MKSFHLPEFLSRNHCFFQLTHACIDFLFEALFGTSRLSNITSTESIENIHSAKVCEWTEECKIYAKHGESRTIRICGGVLGSRKTMQ